MSQIFALINLFIIQGGEVSAQQSGGAGVSRAHHKHKLV